MSHPCIFNRSSHVNFLASFPQSVPSPCMFINDTSNHIKCLGFQCRRLKMSIALSGDKNCSSRCMNDMKTYIHLHIFECLFCFCFYMYSFPAILRIRYFYYFSRQSRSHHVLTYNSNSLIVSLWSLSGP